jgi:hypothetical protein
MKIYLAGNTGFKIREVMLQNLCKKRLLSFYEIFFDKADTHYQKRAFQMIIKK